MYNSPETRNKTPILGDIMSAINNNSSWFTPKTAAVSAGVTIAAVGVAALAHKVYDLGSVASGAFATAQQTFGIGHAINGTAWAASTAYSYVPSVTLAGIGSGLTSIALGLAYTSTAVCLTAAVVFAMKDCYNKCKG